MKIAFIGGRDIHMIGGIESYMYNLATQLVALGHEPIVFCESQSNKIEWVNGFKVVHQRGFKSNLICKPWLGLKATIKIILYEKDVDVIHYNAWPPALWSPIARLFGIKTVMQGHGLEWQRSKYSIVQQKIIKVMEWWTAQINPHLIMCSESQTKYFMQKYKKRATTIPTAINLPSLSRKSESKILEKHSLQSQEYFLFLARLVQDKNPDYLIKAFIAANHKTKKLVVAGDNKADIEYVRYLHNLGKGCDEIIFTGAIYGEDKDTLLRNAYSFCIPSTIEGLSISLLEAMSYSLPIIASDIPANREVLKSDKALWVRPENENDLREAIEYSVNNSTAIKETTLYNYRLVKECYTWEKVAMKYVTYLSALVR